MINRCLSNIDKNINSSFDETIHLVTQLKDDIEPTIKYLKMLGTPVAKIIPQYQTSMTLRAGNYCLKGSNFPKLTVLNIECKFMLLKTILDHYKLVN